MNVAIIGGGGREHALGWGVRKSPLCDAIYFLPGNVGTAKIGENTNIDTTDHQKVFEFCTEKKVELVIVGPEIPLVEGLSDFLRNKKIAVFGPSQKASLIEADKIYAKEVMQRAGVPTAKYNQYNRDEIAEAIDFADSIGYPVVVKANGLAAGKGVSICDNKIEVEKILTEIFQKNIFGKSGDKVLIEEFLIGDEASIFAITDGANFVTLPAAQDHKRIGDGDTGKNTGGMGAYAPTGLITETLLQEIKSSIIEPVLNQLESENNPFAGCLYCGLIITEEGPKVIEFNCRFGDPETQVVVPLLDGDFLKLLFTSASGTLDINAVSYNGGSAVTVIAASDGYPDSYRKGFEINLPDIEMESSIVFHSGTTFFDEKIVTNGGRVLSVTSVNESNNLEETIQIAYSLINKINFENIYFRKDIGQKGLKYK